MEACGIEGLWDCWRVAGSSAASTSFGPRRVQCLPHGLAQALGTNSNAWTLVRTAASQRARLLRRSGSYSSAQESSPTAMRQSSGLLSASVT